MWVTNDFEVMNKLLDFYFYDFGVSPLYILGVEFGTICLPFFGKDTFLKIEKSSLDGAIKYIPVFHCH